MAKPVGNTPLMITIAEKVGAAVGMIVARTSDVVDGATKSLQPPAPSAKPQPKKTAKTRKVKAPKRKAGTIKKKVARPATGTARTGKRSAKK